MSESWLTEFETQLGALERLASAEDVVFSEMLRSARVAINVLAQTSEVQYWLVRPEMVEEINAEGTAQLVPPHEQQIIADAAGRDFLIEERPPQQAASEGESGTASHSTLYVSHRLADQLSLVTGVTYVRQRVPQQSFIEGSGAVNEIIAAFVSRHLLSQYESRLSSQAGLTDIVSRLHKARTLHDVANIIAQDGAAVLGIERLGVLTKTDGRFRVSAVTGVNEPDRASETVRAIESVALDLADRGSSIDSESHEGNTSQWFALEDIGEDSSGMLIDARRCLQTGGTTKVRVLPLAQPANRNGDEWKDAHSAVVCELFADNSVPDESLLRQLMNAANDPLFRHVEREKTFLSRIITGRRKRWLMGMGLTALILVFVPVKFEVEVSGQIVSANQRHIFAPDDGTIDKVLFKNETSVADQAPLLRMSNSDLELQQQQVQGDIDTTTSRLSAVRLSQLTGGRVDQSGDEQQLVQRLKNLKQQQKHLDAQSLALEVRAPFSGTVFRPDSQQELQSRPVQRGQRLLEIVPENPNWELHLSIPSRLLTYVTEYQNSTNVRSTVRYMIRSAPDRDWDTQLSTIDNAIQIENGTTVCRAKALLSELPDVELRPGTSVTARISCGRRSLGFVMFREIIEFWRQLRFAWF